MQQQYLTVLVQFDLTGKFYSYFTDIADIKEGDRAIVIVDGVPKIVKVVQTTGLSRAQHDRAIAIIHSAVDVSDYDNKIRRLQTYQQIRTELRQAKEQHDEMFIYQTIAKDNPRVKELLEQLNTLDGTTPLIEESK